MIDKAFEWAKAQKCNPKKIRTNAVHGEEEIQIVLNDTFEMQDVHEEETNQTGSIDAQEGSKFLTYACTCCACTSHRECFIMHAYHDSTPVSSQDEHGTLLESDLPTMDGAAPLAEGTAPDADLSKCMSFKFLANIILYYAHLI